MAPLSPSRILVIDDDPGVVRGLVGLLRRDGYLVETAANGHHALAQLHAAHYDVILCDVRMPELDGVAFYAVLLGQYASLCHRVIFLTGDTLSVDSMAFVHQSGRPWLPKPCSAAELRSAITQVLRTSAP